MNLQATIALAILCLSVWSALALLLDRRGHARINRRISLVIAFFCLPQAYFYTQLLTPPQDAWVLGLAAQAAIWLKGPLLLSIVRLVLERPMGAWWRHLLPFPLALTGMVFAPEWTLEWGMAGFCALLAYLLTGLFELRADRARLALIYSAYPNSAYYWLLFIVGGLVALVGADLVLMAVAYAQREFPVDFIKVTNWLVASYFVVIAFFSVYRPQVFFHEDRSEPEAPADAASEPRSWRELDPALAEALSRRLLELMEREQLYRQHELSLAELAQRLGVSVHQTSELLNVQHRQSYYEFLNGYRLRHACQLLEDRRCELRVLDIAFEAGFGNKNSFYRSFREMHGVAPVEYRRHAMTQGSRPMPAASLRGQSQNPN